MTRQSLFWAGLVLILFTVNAQIAHKQALLARGRRVLLELAPVDPRSLIQGDYMILDYDVSRKASPAVAPGSTGRLVLGMAVGDVGRYVRVHDGDALAPNEQLIRFRKRARVQLGAEAFFFQEGERPRYQKARFGELRVDSDGESVLVGLCDRELRPL